MNLLIVPSIYGCYGCVLAGRCEGLECECVGNQIYVEVGRWVERLRKLAVTMEG